MRPLRILYAIQGFPPRQTGGSEWETYRRARWLIGTGHDVAVAAVDRKDISLDEPVAVKSEILDGIPIRRISVRSSGSWGDRSEYDDALIYRALQSILQSDAPDLVHVVSGYRTTVAAIHAAADAGVPVVFSAMDFWLVCPRVTLQRRTGELCLPPDDPMTCVVCLANEWRRYRVAYQATHGLTGRACETLWRAPMLRGGKVDRIYSAVTERRRALPAAIDRVARVITASAFLAGLIEDRVVPTNKLVQMRQGLDTSEWLHAGPAEPHPLTFGYVGQIAEHKGVFDLIAAFRRATANQPEVRLVIHGDHEGAWPGVRERLYREVDGDPRIVLAGRFDNRAIRQAHAELDVLVVPSRWYENSPNVILEAFACGTPVITADLGGMAELVTDGVNGLLFAPGDISSLAECLRRVIDAPTLRAALRAGIPAVKTIDEEMAELLGVYRGVVAEAAMAYG